VLILTDQQRADTIAAAGNPVIRTPHLDRLAREGTLYTSAYTPAPVCVPARCSLLYGQYPHHTGCFDNDDPMPVDRPSLMERLAGAGYRTHGVGKMHFMPDGQALRGFQSRERQEEIIDRVEDDDYLPWLQANGFGHVFDPFGQRGEMYYVPQVAQVPARLHGSQWVGDRAVDFLGRTGGDPYFLMVSFIHPHPPFTPPTPWNKLYRGALMPLPKRPAGYEALQTYVNRYQNRYKYRDAGCDDNLLRVMKAYYYACVSFIDYQVGRILAALERSGSLDETLVLYTSDHGELLGDYGCFGKRSMLDSAARVPLLARYPARFAGGRCPVPTSLVDVVPTCLAAAGVGADEGALDGLDLAAVAADAPAYSERTVYSQYQRREQAVYMALDRRWKYSYSAPDREEYLFDRVTDPEETRSRAGLSLCDAPRAAMRRRLLRRFAEDGYADPAEGGGWRSYPQPRWPANPDAGLLIQDAPWSLPFQAIPGYTD
jgi:arylsulfatase